MGYYTEHELSVSDGDIGGFVAVIERISGYSELFGGEAVKWYDHEKDMKSLSAKYPGVVFKLEGIGEEHPDLWVEYHKNGKMQREKAVISFGEFDESKLN